MFLTFSVRLVSRVLALTLVLLMFTFHGAVRAENSEGKGVSELPSETELMATEKAMYSPFVELYFLEELKRLRIDLSDQRHDLMQQIVDRENRTLDRAVTYATDTVTYFFYLIAAASSIFVLVGWNSLREVKDKVHSIADEEVSQLVKTYEARLHSIEEQLRLKTREIASNRSELEMAQEVQSLWLRAGQDISLQNRISLYDEILKLKPDDCEALTYKADTVLELGEPQWAANLCLQALDIDGENGHAYYQLACAYAQLGRVEEALHSLTRAVSLHESYREEAAEDRSLENLRGNADFTALIEHCATVSQD